MLRDETIRRVLKFRDDRDWRQFHTPKDLALSMTLEAGELLEVYQWSGTDLECREKLHLYIPQTEETDGQKLFEFHFQAFMRWELRGLQQSSGYRRKKYFLTVTFIGVTYRILLSWFVLSRTGTALL